MRDRFEVISSRVSIRDLLISAGLKPTQGSRMACPIHGGSNPTSFSFTDKVFVCFSCGANGGLVDLVEHLWGCDRRGALKKLRELAGLAVEGKEGNGRQLTNYGRRSGRQTVPVKLTPEQKEVRDLGSAVELLDTARRVLEERLKRSRKSMKFGHLTLEEFYRIEQSCLYRLEDLDAEFSAASYELRRLRRGYRNGRSHEGSGSTSIWNRREWPAAVNLR